MHHSKLGRSARSLVTIVALVTGALGTFTGVSQAAAICSGSDVRYASSSDTLYITSGTLTLANIMTECPGFGTGFVSNDQVDSLPQNADGSYPLFKPLEKVDGASETWELRMNIVLQYGAELDLYGDTAAGADTSGTNANVDKLRIRSLGGHDDATTIAGSTTTTFNSIVVNSITAQYGTINMDGVNVTSWDDSTGAPDTSFGQGGSTKPIVPLRAFIRALSTLANGNVPNESTMNINNSNVSNLGSSAAEAYGLAWKVRGDDTDSAAGPGCPKGSDIAKCSHAIFNELNVYGTVTNSVLHDNFMGTYTFGGQNMDFEHDIFAHNYMYGLDGHDDSDYTTVKYNQSFNNGDHGIICSQRCDHWDIEYNESYGNGGPNDQQHGPYTGPGDDDSSDNQVHGIMLHRGCTQDIVAHNYVHDMVNGAGIAIFDSSDNTISNNTVSGNKFGLRVSVGAARNTFTNNEIDNSSQYAFFAYLGSDAADYNTTDLGGRPNANVFTNNTVNGTGSNLVKFNDSDNNVFSGNKISNAGDYVRFVTSTGNVWKNNPGSPAVRTFGGTAAGGQAITGQTSVLDTFPVFLQIDANSTATVGSTLGTIRANAATPVSATGWTTPDTTVGSDVGYAVTNWSVLSAAGSTATATANVSGSGTSGVLSLVAGTATANDTFTVSGFTAGTSYVVYKNGTVLKAAVKANSAGNVVFTSQPPAATGSATSRTTTYQIKTS